MHIWNPYFYSREYEIEIKSGEKSLNDEIEINQFKKKNRSQPVLTFETGDSMNPRLTP
jgi:hypothetical protein